MTDRSRVNELDFLRFAAALSVMFYHYSGAGHAAGLTVMSYPWTDGLFGAGALGVQLFFMISGFVILASAANRSASDFLISRAVRLYPAMWACCTITFAMILAFGAPVYSASWPQYLANMALIAGFTGSEYIDSTYWTLSVEIRFYLLTALVLMAGQIKRIEFLLALWLAFAALPQAFAGDFLWRLFVSEYAGYFVAGAAMYLVRARGLSLMRAGLIAAAYPLCIRQGFAQDSANGAAIAFIVALFFILFLAIAFRRLKVLADIRWRALGALTYPLYLIHQAAGNIIFNAAFGVINIHVLFWGTIGLMIAAAYLIHAVVERRLAPVLRRGLLALRDRGRAIAARAS